ncbi:MAG: hypothetical protein NVS9B10_28360 [Nevskia sp.]
MRIFQAGRVGALIGASILGVAASVQAAESARDSGFGYKFYYGVLHTQTAWSDGGWPNDATCTSSTALNAARLTPAQAYAYAKNNAPASGIDFLGISDHNHYWPSSYTAATVISHYHDGLTQAANATTASFVAIYGMEWGYNSNDNYPNEGHINLYETSKLFGWKNGSDGRAAYEVYTNPSQYVDPTGGKGVYSQALANPPAGLPAIGQFNHPADRDYGSGSYLGDDYQKFAYTTYADDLMHLLAVVSGNYVSKSTNSTGTGDRHAGPAADAPGGIYSPYTDKDMFNTALAAGFHVAPVADPDVHCSNYGNSGGDRTVALIPAGTAYSKAALFDAFHNRRVYATSNRGVQLVFTLASGANTYVMGAGGIRASGPVLTSGALTLHVSALSANNSIPVNSITIKEVKASDQANGTSTDAVTPATGLSSANFTITPAAGRHTYYAYVKAGSGDQLWSAPIWINQQ